eukprot:g11416.t1
MGKQRLTKNQKRRLKKKEKQKQNSTKGSDNTNRASSVNNKTNARGNRLATNGEGESHVDDEYVTEEMDVELAKHFSDVAKNSMFQIRSKEKDTPTDQVDNGTSEKGANGAFDGAGDGVEQNLNSDNKKKEKKKSAKKKRMTLAELKFLAPYPEVIEPEDVASPEPLFLASLKGHPNYVPVPRHWRNKRGYLQGKRSVEGSTYQLPDYIAATGIQEVRQAAIEAEENRSLKQIGRAKMRPKMGQMDIDYKILHDAFFRYQTRAETTNFGDLYYENKEYEKKKKFQGIPGVVSKSLREALGMPHGESVPPPWLLNMQRYGPPKAYPNLKLPGVNAALPDGAQYGFHAGGWGQPPLDVNGKPMWGGDLFGGFGNTSDSVAGSGKNTALEMSRLEQYIQSFDTTSCWGRMEEKVWDDDDEDESEGEEGANSKN